MCGELSVPAVPVIAVGEHDTASAVVGIPAETDDFAYLICGTWSLIGTELDAPLMTNRRSIGILQMRAVPAAHSVLKHYGIVAVPALSGGLGKDGISYSSAELVKLAGQSEAFRSAVDPDDPVFLNPVHMPEAIREYCRAAGQHVPETPGQIIRCVLESLAFKYRFTFERIETLTGKNMTDFTWRAEGFEMNCSANTRRMYCPEMYGLDRQRQAPSATLPYRPSRSTCLGYSERPESDQGFLSSKTYVPEDTEAWERAYRRYTSQILGAASR
ncbi:FGGY-family carbohydrate kinase [Bacillus licheniformis]|nr:FGGY-family carbohydrate kinase [Bacillus licheniformis]